MATGSTAAPLERPDGATGRVELALALLVLLGAAVRLVGLGSEPLWLDEAFSWRWAHLSLAELWGPAARTETNPPLWFALERLAILALGESEAALRLPAALFGIAAVPLAFLAGRALAGSSAGLGAALLLAADPLLVAYSQEARGYALLVAGTVLVLWGGQELLTGTDPAGKRRSARLPAAGYALGATVAVYAHNTGALVPLLANLAWAILWLARARGARPPVLPWLLANLPPFLLGLAWLPTLVEQAAGAGNVGWIAQPGPRWALLSWLGLFGPHFLGLGPVLGAVFGLPVLFLAGLAVRRLGRRTVLPLAFATGGPLLLLGLGLLIRPLWLERVLLPWAVATLVLAGVGLAATFRDVRPMRVLVALLLVLRAADLAAWHLRPQKLPWPEAAAALAREFQPGDGILVVPHFYHWPWAYYARRAGLPPEAIGLVVGAPPPPEAPHIRPIDDGFRLARPAELDAVLEGRERGWLLAYKRRGGDPAGVLAILEARGRLEPRLRLEGAWDRGELELWLWTRGGSGAADSGIVGAGPRA